MHSDSPGLNHDRGKQVYYRLIALWVIAEALLGGIIHGLKLPVSGLIVGSAAITCISLIGYYHPVRGAILKATIIVAIFKMMLSPQSPVAAYIAVFFQGLVGSMLFSGRKNFHSRAIFFAVIALLESGVQRILVLTIIYGKDLWYAIDVFINSVTHEETITSYSYMIAAGYVGLHVLVGLLLGRFIGLLPRLSNNLQDNFNIPNNPVSTEWSTPNKKRKGKSALLIVWIILSVIYVQGLIVPEKAWLPSGLIFKLLFRSLLIVTTWTVIISPLLLRLLYGWLERKKSAFGSEIQEINGILPFMKYLATESWKLSAEKRGLNRMILFGRILLVNSIRDER